MIGTLSTAIGGTPIGFLNRTRPSPANSTGKVCFQSGKASKASLHAVTEAESVDSIARKPVSFYEVLRIKRNATPNEIKMAYRSLAKVYHPDASEFKQQDDREFIEIHNAYATLYDPAERAMYDLKLSTGLGRRSGSYTAGGNRGAFYTTRRWETDQCW